MDASISLLDRAQQAIPLTQLAEEIGVRHTALSNCRKVGHLSPLIAGGIAVFLSENVEHWMAVAAAESAREGKAKRMLLRHLQDRAKR